LPAGPSSPGGSGLIKGKVNSSGNPRKASSRSWPRVSSTPSRGTPATSGARTATCSRPCPGAPAAAQRGPRDVGGGGGDAVCAPSDAEGTSCPTMLTAGQCPPPTHCVPQPAARRWDYPPQGCGSLFLPLCPPPAPVAWIPRRATFWANRRAGSEAGIPSGIFQGVARMG